MAEVGAEKHHKGLPGIIHHGFGHQTEIAHAHAIGSGLDTPGVFECSHPGVELSCTQMPRMRGTMADTSDGARPEFFKVDESSGC